MEEALIIVRNVRTKMEKIEMTKDKVDYFYHATGDDENNLKKMLNIIKTGYITSKRKIFT